MVESIWRKAWALYKVRCEAVHAQVKCACVCVRMRVEVPGMVREMKAKAMCFFFYVSRHFFFTKPMRAREKKQNVQRKKNALALGIDTLC